MSKLKAYTAKKIFTGDQWLHDHAIICNEDEVVDVQPLESLDSSISLQNFHNAMIAPAFIDLQIYGAYGKLLAVYPETDSLYKLIEYCNKGGAAFCLPTIATNTKEAFYKCIDTVKEYWSEGGKGVLGLHLEGPWINPAKRGAHVEELIHSPAFSEVKDILAYGKDVIRMITLAPEQCSEEIISYILSENIIVSAGHSNASYDQAKDSFEKGVTTVTHLFNAMSAFQHREPGLAGAVMDNNKTFASIIPDGHHVDFAAIRIAKRIMGERLFVITDAVTDTREGYYPHVLNGDKYESSGILSGSALTMIKAVKNLVVNNVTDLSEALRMCSLYPARVIGLDQQYGKIKTGYHANLAVIDNDFKVIKLIGE